MKTSSVAAAKEFIKMTDQEIADTATYTVTTYRIFVMKALVIIITLLLGMRNDG